MKKLLLVLLGFLIYPLASETVNIYEDIQVQKFYTEYCKDKEKCPFDDWYQSYKTDHPTLYELSIKTINPGYGIFEVATGRCNTELRYNIPRREYFQCNKVQIFVSDLLGF